jgi:hypothetical protein
MTSTIPNRVKFPMSLNEAACNKCGGICVKHMQDSPPMLLQPSCGMPHNTALQPDATWTANNAMPMELSLICICIQCTESSWLSVGPLANRLSTVCGSTQRSPWLVCPGWAASGHVPPGRASRAQWLTGHHLVPPAAGQQQQHLACKHTCTVNRPC